MYKEVSKAVVAGVGEFVYGADSAENQSEVPTQSDTQDELDPSRVEPCNAAAQSLCNCRAFASVSLLMLWTWRWRSSCGSLSRVARSWPRCTRLQVRLAMVEMSHNSRRLLAPIFEDGELLRVSVVGYSAPVSYGAPVGAAPTFRGAELSLQFVWLIQFRR